MKTLAVVLLVSVAYAATINGTLYGPDLEVLNGSILNVNTTPSQTIVLKEGTYSLELPAGNYRIDAYYEEGGVYYTATENITITGNGSFTVDLILLPNFDEDIGDFQIDVPDGEPANEGNTPLILGVAATSIAIIGILIWRVAKKRKRFPQDVAIVAKVLEENGGRMTQKEVREVLGWSEAKLSLVLAEMASEGLVKKIKQGRGNIIILKKFPTRKI